MKSCPSSLVRRPHSRKAASLADHAEIVVRSFRLPCSARASRSSMRSIASSKRASLLRSKLNHSSSSTTRRAARAAPTPLGTDAKKRLRPATLSHERSR
jgi:hypothetical protein